MKYSMHAVLLGFLISGGFVFAMEEPEINLFLTTALVDNEHSLSRREEYCRSFEQCKKLGYEYPYVVEGVRSHGPTFFEDLTVPERVYYFQNNNPQDKNRGKFEGMSMLEALEHFELDPNSFVYKHTGRYFATKDLAQVVKNFPGYDAYVKRSDEKGWLILAAFVFKYGKLKKMYASLDYDAMERQYDPANKEASFIENFTTRYIQQAEQEKKLDVLLVDDLGLEINTAFSSTGVDPNSQKKY